MTLFRTNSPDEAAKLITVSNVLRDSRHADHLIYCGRQSSWKPEWARQSIQNASMGNPHPGDGTTCKLCRVKHNRDECIIAFETDLERTAPEHKWKLEIKRLAILAMEGHTIQLFCFCSPQKCHCDVIKRHIKWHITQMMGGPE